MLHGAQLESEIRLAMPAAGIRSVSELARRSQVQRDTLYEWFRGERAPKPATLEKVAGALHVRLGDLWDYQAPESAPPPAISAEELAAIEQAVAAGVARGVAQVLAELGQPAAPPLPRRPPRQ